jgi:hypothetical protein
MRADDSSNGSLWLEETQSRWPQNSLQLNYLRSAKQNASSAITVRKHGTQCSILVSKYPRNILGKVSQT